MEVGPPICFFTSNEILHRLLPRYLVESTTLAQGRVLQSGGLALGAGRRMAGTALSGLANAGRSSLGHLQGVERGLLQLGRATLEEVSALEARRVAPPLAQPGTCARTLVRTRPEQLAYHVQASLCLLEQAGKACCSDLARCVADILC